jgi:iron complex transport system substrate-binding protein
LASSSLRIVSLLPSATEIVCALGLADSLVAVTHECDYPAEVVRQKPVITSSLLHPSVAPAEEGVEAEEPVPLTAGEINAKVRAALAAGESLYRIDHEMLRALKPDIVLTQGLCDVCAVNHAAVKAAVEALGTGPTVLDLAPTTLAGVLDTFRQVGAAAGVDSAAEQLVTRTQARWDAVREKAGALAERPKTLLLEWPDPPFSAGHWNPELLQLANGAGGPWDVPGEASRTLTWEEITAFGPEMIVLMACGFDAYRALDEAWALTDAPGWYDLPAVRLGECYTLDGSAYFNRPGPRLAESAEILATVLHPETFTEMLPPYSAQRFSDDMLTPEAE